MENSRQNAQKLEKKKRKNGWFYNLLIVICVTAMAYSGYQLWLIFSEYQKADSSYDKIIDTVTTPNDNYPDIDFAALREINPEVIAWIYIPDTKINYPVVSGRDNAYYLNHLLDGTRSASGSIFLDMNNSPDFSDDNSILHGHHMKNGSMFAQIEKYKNQEFYDEHPIGYLITPEQVYRVEFFAGVIRNGSSELPIMFGSPENQEEWVGTMRAGSTFKGADFELVDSTRFLSLSTCDYSISDGRYLLSGRLVAID